MGRGGLICSEWPVTNLNCPFVQNAATLSYLVHVSSRGTDRRGAKLNELREIRAAGRSRVTYLLPRIQSLIHFCVEVLQYVPFYIKYIKSYVAWKIPLQYLVHMGRPRPRRCGASTHTTWRHGSASRGVHIAYWFWQSVQFACLDNFWESSILLHISLNNACIFKKVIISVI